MREMFNKKGSVKNSAEKNRLENHKRIERPTGLPVVNYLTPTPRHFPDV